MVVNFSRLNSPFMTHSLVTVTKLCVCLYKYSLKYFCINLFHTFINKNMHILNQISVINSLNSKCDNERIFASVGSALIESEAKGNECLGSNS